MTNKVDASKKMDEYFSKNLAYLRASNGLSMAELASLIGTGKSIIGNYEKGTAEPSASTVLKIVQYFGHSLEDLMTLDLSKKGHGVTHKIKAYPQLKWSKEGATIEETAAGTLERIVDSSGLKLIPITDIKAAAGTGYINSDHFDETDVIRLPAHMIKSGNHLCISIRGTSMAPTLQDGGYVIIRHLDRGEWEDLISDRIYVIVDTDNKTYLKRVKNRLSGEKGFLVLTSDSPDKVSNPSFNLRVQDIQHVWYVVWYFTAKMPNIHDQYYNRLSTLEDTVQLMQQQFNEFSKKK